MVEALKNSLKGIFSYYKNEGILIADYFNKVQRFFFRDNEAEFNDFCRTPELKSLFIDFIKINLKKADYQGIDFSVKFFEKYLDSDASILEDRAMQRIISEAVFINLIEPDRPYLQNVEKISKTFLVGREKELIRLAVAARALLLDRAQGNDLKNAEIINNRFLKIIIGKEKEDNIDDEIKVA